MKKIILIYGLTGYGRVIADAVEQYSARARAIFFDEVNAPYDPKFKRNRKLVLAVKDNVKRKEISNSFSHAFGIVIHPSAQIAKDVEIGEGTVVLANAVIQSGAVIGKHCIIDANVVVGPNVKLGDFVSIDPGTYIGEGYLVAGLSHIEPNSILR